MQKMILLQILLFAQHVSGTTMSIIRSSRVLYRWLLPVVFRALVFKLSVWCGAEGYVSGLLLIMGIVVSETRWASNKICNKNHPLHLVGILFPHINDDARSKSHQIKSFYFILTNFFFLSKFYGYLDVRFAGCCCSCIILSSSWWWA